MSFAILLYLFCLGQKLQSCRGQRLEHDGHLRFEPLPSRTTPMLYLCCAPLDHLIACPCLSKLEGSSLVTLQLHPSKPHQASNTFLFLLVLLLFHSLKLMLWCLFVTQYLNLRYGRPPTKCEDLLPSVPARQTFPIAIAYRKCQRDQGVGA